MRSRIAAAFSGVTKDLLPKASSPTTTTTTTTTTANAAPPAARPRREAAAPRPPACAAPEASQDFERTLAAVEARIDQMTDDEVTAFARRIGILR
jgi:hypothetical protein